MEEIAVDSVHAAASEAETVAVEVVEGVEDPVAAGIRAKRRNGSL